LEQDSMVVAKSEDFTQAQPRMNDGMPQVAPADHAGTHSGEGGEDLRQHSEQIVTNYYKRQHPWVL